MRHACRFELENMLSAATASAGRAGQCEVALGALDEQRLQRKLQLLFDYDHANKLGFGRHELRGVTDAESLKKACGSKALSPTEINTLVGYVALRAGRGEGVADTVSERSIGEYLAASLTPGTKEHMRTITSDAHTKKIPAVNLCYGGGWGSADCVWAAVSQGFGVILIADSGRLCNAVGRWRQYLREQKSGPRTRAISEEEKHSCFECMESDEEKRKTLLLEYGSIVDALARYDGPLSRSPVTLNNPIAEPRVTLSLRREHLES